MLLSDLIKRFSDETVAAEAILGLRDLTLLGRATAAAAAEDLPLGEFVVSAVRRYAAAASGEEWVTLMGALGRSNDPGLTYLKRALDFVLKDHDARERHQHREVQKDFSATSDVD